MGKRRKGRLRSAAGVFFPIRRRARNSEDMSSATGVVNVLLEIVSIVHIVDVESITEDSGREGREKKRSQPDVDVNDVVIEPIGSQQQCCVFPGDDDIMATMKRVSESSRNADR